MRSARIATLTLLALLVLGVAVPAIAQDEEGTEDETTETVAEDAEGTSYTPAVQVEPESELDPTPPWTARYLIPTGLVLAAVAVFVTVIQYFVRVVRNRYKPVE